MKNKKRIGTQRIENFPLYSKNLSSIFSILQANSGLEGKDIVSPNSAETFINNITNLFQHLRHASQNDQEKLNLLDNVLNRVTTGDITDQTIFHFVGELYGVARYLIDPSSDTLQDIPKSIRDLALSSASSEQFFTLLENDLRYKIESKKSNISEETVNTTPVKKRVLETNEDSDASKRIRTEKASENGTSELDKPDHKAESERLMELAKKRKEEGGLFKPGELVLGKKPRPTQDSSSTAEPEDDKKAESDRLMELAKRRRLEGGLFKPGELVLGDKKRSIESTKVTVTTQEPSSHIELDDKMAESDRLMELAKKRKAAGGALNPSQLILRPSMRSVSNSTTDISEGQTQKPTVQAGKINSRPIFRSQLFSEKNTDSADINAQVFTFVRDLNRLGFYLELKSHVEKEIKEQTVIERVIRTFEEGEGLAPFVNKAFANNLLMEFLFARESFISKEKKGLYTKAFVEFISKQFLSKLTIENLYKYVTSESLSDADKVNVVRGVIPVGEDISLEGLALIHVIFHKYAKKGQESQKLFESLIVSGAIPLNERLDRLYLIGTQLASKFIALFPAQEASILIEGVLKAQKQYLNILSAEKENSQGDPRKLEIIEGYEAKLHAMKEKIKEDLSIESSVYGQETVLEILQFLDTSHFDDIYLNEAMRSSAIEKNLIPLAKACLFKQCYADLMQESSSQRSLEFSNSLDFYLARVSDCENMATKELLVGLIETIIEVHITSFVDKYRQQVIPNEEDFFNKLREALPKLIVNIKDKFGSDWIPLIKFNSIFQKFPALEPVFNKILGNIRLLKKIDDKTQQELGSNTEIDTDTELETDASIGNDPRVVLPFVSRLFSRSNIVTTLDDISRAPGIFLYTPTQLETYPSSHVVPYVEETLSFLNAQFEESLKTLGETADKFPSSGLIQKYSGTVINQSFMSLYQQDENSKGAQLLSDVMTTISDLVVRLTNYSDDTVTLDQYLSFLKTQPDQTPFNQLEDLIYKVTLKSATIGSGIFSLAQYTTPTQNFAQWDLMSGMEAFDQNAISDFVSNKLKETRITEDEREQNLKELEKRIGKNIYRFNDFKSMPINTFITAISKLGVAEKSSLTGIVSMKKKYTDEKVGSWNQSSSTLTAWLQDRASTLPENSVETLNQLATLAVSRIAFESELRHLATQHPLKMVQLVNTLLADIDSVTPYLNASADAVSTEFEDITELRHKESLKESQLIDETRSTKQQIAKHVENTKKLIEFIDTLLGVRANVKGMMFEVSVHRLPSITTRFELFSEAFVQAQSVKYDAFEASNIKKKHKFSLRISDSMFSSTAYDSSDVEKEFSINCKKVRSMIDNPNFASLMYLSVLRLRTNKGYLDNKETFFQLNLIVFVKAWEFVLKNPESIQHIVDNDAIRDIFSFLLKGKVFDTYERFTNKDVIERIKYLVEDRTENALETLTKMRLIQCLPEENQGDLVSLLSEDELIECCKYGVNVKAIVSLPNLKERVLLKLSQDIILPDPNQPQTIATSAHFEQIEFSKLSEDQQRAFFTRIKGIPNLGKFLYDQFLIRLNADVKYYEKVIGRVSALLQLPENPRNYSIQHEMEVFLLFHLFNTIADPRNREAVRSILNKSQTAEKNLVAVLSTFIEGCKAVTRRENIRGVEKIFTQKARDIYVEHSKEDLRAGKKVMVKQKYDLVSTITFLVEAFKVYK